MQVDRVTVSAALTVRHPSVQFSNVKPEVSVSALLQPNDDTDECIRQLQVVVNRMLSEQIAPLASMLEENA